MRKFLISLLLASAAASPALAAPSDDSDGQQTRGERQQARSERQQAREQARSERTERSVEIRSHSNDAPARPQLDVVRRDTETARQAREVVRDQRIEERQGLRDERRAAIQENRELRQSERPLPRVLRTPVPVVSDTPREGTQPPLKTDSRPSNWTAWHTDWRHNSKYDWYNWRKRHRWLFHFGFYSDPFGWGYRPYSIGWRMWPSYYGSNYWLDDPWMYRLPYAPPGYRWIRYYDDALLVDTWTGEVVDVLYNFFW